MAESGRILNYNREAQKQRTIIPLTSNGSKEFKKDEVINFYSDGYNIKQIRINNSTPIPIHLEINGDKNNLWVINANNVDSLIGVHVETIKFLQDSTIQYDALATKRSE